MCSLFPARNQRISSSTISVEFKSQSKNGTVSPEPVVHDLFPKQILERATLAHVKTSGLRIETKEVEQKKETNDRDASEIIYNDAVLGSGFGTSKAVWKFQNLKEGITGDKNLYLILKCDRKSRISGRVYITTEMDTYILNKIKLPVTKTMDLITNAELVLYEPSADDVEKVWRTLMTHMCPRHRNNTRNGKPTDWDIENLRTEHYDAYTNPDYFRSVLRELARRHGEIQIKGNAMGLTEEGLKNCSKYDPTFQRDFY